MTVAVIQHFVDFDHVVDFVHIVEQLLKLNVYFCMLIKALSFLVLLVFVSNCLGIIEFYLFITDCFFFIYPANLYNSVFI